MSTVAPTRSFTGETKIFDRSVDSTNFLLDNWWFWALVVAVVLIAFYLQSKHKLLGELDERCEAAFGDVDVLLAARHNLIDNLVATVKGFASQEHKVLKDVIDARARATSATGGARLDAEAQVGQALANVWSLAEAYPVLASSAHFREMRNELVRMEDRISASRKFYNLAVEELGGVRRAFPANLIDRLTKIGTYEKFSLGERREALFEPARVSF